jgi:hypothetical protein
MIRVIAITPIFVKSAFSKSIIFRVKSIFEPNVFKSNNNLKNHQFKPFSSLMLKSSPILKRNCAINEKYFKNNYDNPNTSLL